MRIGSLVKHYELVGIVIDTKGPDWAEIYWTDVEELGGSIIAWWENYDFQVIG